ncbi:MAG: peptidoglycan DD-metalloendopeptidase family protein [Oscillospiraceae bacterium]|jgi:murein DD-endopeptidase MepM/ murein hydrolase activator NlpD|nr:peptidoglycan DD-metalloendopeptidase family protein [Oscillospiraceae bacterium]
MNNTFKRRAFYFYLDIAQLSTLSAAAFIKTIIWYVGRFFLFLRDILRPPLADTLQRAAWLGRQIASPFTYAYRNFLRLRRDLYVAARASQKPRDAYAKYFKSTFVGKHGIAVTVFNIAAPVVCGVFFLQLIGYSAAATYAIRLEVDGIFLGYIENESVFSEAESIAENRLNQIGGGHSVSSVPSFKLENVAYADYLSTYSIAETLFEKAGVSLEYAYGVSIDGRFLGAVRDNTELKKTLNGLLDVYRTGVVDETVEFVNKVECDTLELYNTESIINVQDLITLFTSTRSSAMYYTIEEGDSPSLIADKLGTTMLELERNNPGFLTTMLVPGERLLQNMAIPYLSVALTTTETYSEAIPFDTETRDSDAIYIGQTAVYQKGVEGKRTISARVSKVNGIETRRVALLEVTESEPVTKIVLSGTVPTPQGSYSAESAEYGKFIWPVSKSVAYISEVPWYDGGYSGHQGVDFACKVGTPIYACASGTVSSAKDARDGYGMRVIIDHPSGLRTLYAHMSQIYVKAGQVVTQGECIGLVGMTGYVTGPHVHLEVRNGNTFLDPLNYVTYTRRDFSVR